MSMDFSKTARELGGEMEEFVSSFVVNSSMFKL
jgi:hypothetical protein